MEEPTIEPGAISGPAANDAPLQGAIPAPPPHPFDSEWFLNINGQNYGPYTGHKLKEFVTDGRTTGESLVVRTGATDWHKVSDDAILKTLLPAQIPDRVPPPPSNVTAREGATVVQVTNTITAPHPAFVLDDGLAAAKSPGVALLLSILFCGAGQMYNGQVGKGFLMLFGCIFLWLIFLGWIINIWSMIDAYQTAKMMNFRYQQRLIAAAAQPR
jgi:TM2 domain-containing membrane protein YozV